MRISSSLVALGAAALLGASAGCGSSGQDEPAAPVAPTAPETPAAAPADPAPIEDETSALLGGKIHDQSAPATFEDAAPRSMFGFLGQGFPADARGARRFIDAHAEELGVTGSLEDLAADEPIESPMGRHIVLRQTVGGVPVYGADVRVHFDANGDVVAATSTYAPGAADVLTVVPAISHGVAVDVARSALPAGADDAEAEGELVVLADASAASLAWRVQVTTERASWEVFVDARDGSVAREPRDQTCFGKPPPPPPPPPPTRINKGRVFNVNAVVATHNTGLRDSNDSASAVPASAYTEVDLLGLGTTGKLDGPYVSTSGTRTRASSAANDFRFDRSNDGFSECMVYYWLDASQRYIQSLGFSNVNNRVQVCNIAVNKQDNSYYLPSARTLNFGTGGVDDAEDAEVVWHEYGHSIQDNQVPGFGSTEEGGAMGEGFGDYWAGSMSAQHSGGYSEECLAEWDATSYASPPCLRMLVSSKHYPLSSDGEVHDDGEMWSATLWQVRAALIATFGATDGPKISDKIVLGAHFYLLPAARFTDGASAIVTSANAYNTAALQADPNAVLVDVAQVRGILQARGFTVQ